jgi:hypothetical protein
MSISFPPNAGEVTGPDTPTSVPYSATNAVILAANANRANGGMIINNGTKVLWITVNGAPAGVGSGLSIPIPANGGVYDLPGNYKGNVNGIWATGGAGSATIHEFSIV